MAWVFSQARQGRGANSGGRVYGLDLREIFTKEQRSLTKLGGTRF